MHWFSMVLGRLCLSNFYSQLLDLGRSLLLKYSALFFFSLKWDFEINDVCFCTNHNKFKLYAGPLSSLKYSALFVFFLKFSSETACLFLFLRLLKISCCRIHVLGVSLKTHELTLYVPGALFSPQIVVRYDYLCSDSVCPNQVLPNLMFWGSFFSWYIWISFSSLLKLRLDSWMSVVSICSNRRISCTCSRAVF